MSDNAMQEKVNMIMDRFFDDIEKELGDKSDMRSQAVIDSIIESIVINRLLELIARYKLIPQNIIVVGWLATLEKGITDSLRDLNKTKDKQAGEKNEHN